ncbi:MAG: hypothetical protein HUU41_06370 [Bryobacteraceae bacterium]|nr:hypothetical protein [Bryobacteraceae bacterium]
MPHKWEVVLSFLKIAVYTALPYIGAVVISFASARSADCIIARSSLPVQVCRHVISARFLPGSAKSGVDAFTA